MVVGNIAVELIVGLGTKVAVNFIIPMGFLKTVKAVIDCYVNQVRIPLHGGNMNFPIHYMLPKRYQAPLAVTQTSNLSFFRENRRAAFEQLPASEAVVAVIRALLPNSEWLGPAKDMVEGLRALAAAPIPPTI